MLVFQDPTDETGPNLLQSLSDAFSARQQIHGMFAYASAAGIRLLTGLKAFQEVAKRDGVEIIVGTDAITDTRAIETLAAVAKQFPKISARAFLNPQPRGIFHPKFCFSTDRNGGCLVTGSGNLTEGGLQGNWEAHWVEDLDREGVADVTATWNYWRERHREWVMPLDDARIRARVALNHHMAVEGDMPILEAKQGTTIGIPTDAAVLIAEIPRSKDRWKQANFDKQNFETFFGANETRLVTLRHVREHGMLDDYEPPRPPVAVKSQNYRLELAAAVGEYPSNGRPIAVFIRMAGRIFFYRLLFPSDREYATVNVVLERHKQPRKQASHLRRAPMTVATLRTEWPSAPFWKLPSVS